MSHKIQESLGLDDVNETTYLINNDQLLDTCKTDKVFNISRTTLKSGAILGSIGLGMLLISGAHQDLFASTSSLSTTSSRSITAVNEYGEFGKSYPFYGSLEMVEPHISTTLTAMSDGVEMDDEIAWEIETSSGVYEYPVGNSVVVTFTDLGKLSVKWCKTSSSSSRRLGEKSKSFVQQLTTMLPTLLNSNLISSEKKSFGGFTGNLAPNRNLDLTAASLDTNVFGIYVRREIRGLSTSDRKAFFDACEIVFRVPTEKGQALYGDKYYGIGYYGDLHNTYAGNSDCDHMHDGLGFMTSHSALTLMFEQTLQAINPRVTVPYWDYTIDMTNYEISGELSSFFGSVVFTDEYFGASVTKMKSSAADDDLVEAGYVDPSGRITTGRFTDVEVSLDYWGITSTVYNAYGHIRSPWNNNNDPYVNRFNQTFGFDAVGNAGSRRRLADLKSGGRSLKSDEGDDSGQFGSVDCSTIYTVMQYDSWYDFGMQSEYQPHGPVHTLIGGTSGADYKSAILSRVPNVNIDLVEAWSLLAFGLMKDMWRSGKMTCPTSCSTDAPISECKCYCGDIDAWTASDATAKAALEDIDEGVFSQTAYTTDLEGNDISTIILKTLCNEFDELVPVIGESLQSSSTLDISFWPMHPFMDRLLHWKRIHTGFSDTAWGPDGVDVEASCYGHSVDDHLGWKNLYDNDNHEYTNLELFDIMDPTVTDIEDYGQNYVYDEFRWDHCTELGYPATLFDDSLVEVDDE